VTVLIDKVKGTTTWIGHVEGEPGTVEVFLTIHGNTMSGNVQIGDKTYEIEPKRQQSARYYPS